MHNVFHDYVTGGIACYVIITVFYKLMTQLTSEVARMEEEKGERSKPQPTMMSF